MVINNDTNTSFYIYNQISPLLTKNLLLDMIIDVKHYTHHRCSDIKHRIPKFICYNVYNKKEKTTINARVINENVARFLSSSCFINTLL